VNGRFPEEGTNPEYTRTAMADYQTFTKFKVKKIHRWLRLKDLLRRIATAALCD